MAGMPGDALLIGIAQLAIVVAGFTAISATLLPGGSRWNAAQGIRLRTIVSTSFNVAFESLLPLIAYPALADERSSLVLSSALIAVYLTGIVLIRARQTVRARALHMRAIQLILTAAVGSIVLFALDAVVFGSLTVYAAALGVQLSVAAISFYSLVSAATGSNEGA